MKIVNVAPHSEAWHSWRSEGITATDACVLAGDIGFKPYETYDVIPFKTEYQLWAEKVLKIEPVDISCNPYVRRGVRYEDAARRMLEKKFSTILLPVCVESESNSFLRASLDGLRSQKGVHEPVEIKVPSDHNFSVIEQYGKNCGLYWKYYPQVQHQLLVTGASRGWLAFYSPNEGGRMRLFEILRDEAYLERMKIKYRGFEAMMVSRKQPKLDTARDSFQPSELLVDEWRELENGVIDLDKQVKALEAKLAAVRSQQELKHNRMVEIMRDNGNFYVYRTPKLQVKRFFRKGRINYDRLLDDHALDSEVSIDNYREPSQEQVRITVRSS